MINASFSHGGSAGSPLLVTELINASTNREAHGGLVMALGLGYDYR